MTNKDELRALCLAATPGPYAVVDGHYPCFKEIKGPSFTISVCVSATGITFEDAMQRYSDMALIAAMAPDTTLALLDRIAELEGRLSAADEVDTKMAARIAELESVVDQRNAELSRIKSSTITHDEWYEQCNDITRKDALLRDAKEAHLEAIYSMTTKAYNLAKASVAAIEKELAP